MGGSNGEGRGSAAQGGKWTVWGVVLGGHGRRDDCRRGPFWATCMAHGAESASVECGSAMTALPFSTIRLGVSEALLADLWIGLMRPFTPSRWPTVQQSTVLNSF